MADDDRIRDRRREFAPTDRPSPPALDNDIENNHDIPRLIDDSGMHRHENSPFHILSQTPDYVKLIATSLFVAAAIQRFVFKGRNSTGSTNYSWGVNSESNFVGTAAAVSSRPDADRQAARYRNYDRLIPSKPNRETKVTDQVTDDSSAKPHKCKVRPINKSKKKKSSVAKRNYDKLVAPKEPDGSGCEKSNVTSKDPIAESSINNTQTQLEALNTPPIQLHSKECHPGLTAYYNWLSTTTSLYRIYSIPSYSDASLRSNSSMTRNDPSAVVSAHLHSGSTFHPAILPMQPSSERGQVPVYLEVTNQTSHESIHVYWVDYKGNEIFKGSISNRGGIWNQTTYIGHPWTFRIGTDYRQPTGEESVLLKYVPFRVIPTVVGAETAQQGSYNGPVVGRQRFTIKDVPDGLVSREGYSPVCFVEDSIMPEPPLIRSLDFDAFLNDNSNNPWASTIPFSQTKVAEAIRWSCLQMQREDAANPGRGLTSAKRLLQYLRNICLHPAEPKYRKLRTGNRVFMDAIYNTGARGVLLALGFEEHLGYLEMGPGEGKTLSYDRIRDVSDAMEIVSNSVKLIENGDYTNVYDGRDIQPEGADGFGRAGFGRADGMNL